MKKLNKVALLFATAALAVPTLSHAQAPAAPTAEQLKAANAADNWRSTDGNVWRNGTNELCWRDAFWTPATAHPFCDGALKPPPPPPPAPRVAPPPPPPVAAPVVVPVPVAPPVAEKVTFDTIANFDFDKYVLKVDDQARLADLVEKGKGISLEVMVVTGHTDSIGTAEYNQKLSIRRADAVKDFLVSKGVEKNRIYTEGKGLTSPIADNKTSEGRAKNRRVSTEVFGTRVKK